MATGCWTWLLRTTLQTLFQCFWVTGMGAFRPRGASERETHPRTLQWATSTWTACWIWSSRTLAPFRSFWVSLTVAFKRRGASLLGALLGPLRWAISMGMEYWIAPWPVLFSP